MNRGGYMLPLSFGRVDIDRLHALSWTDTDIIEATFHGADMVRH
jgi:hypothetical protein